jgi:hypothetical protein
MEPGRLLPGKAGWLSDMDQRYPDVQQHNVLHRQDHGAPFQSFYALLYLRRPGEILLHLPARRQQPALAVRGRGAGIRLVDFIWNYFRNFFLWSTKSNLFSFQVLAKIIVLLKIKALLFQVGCAAVYPQGGMSVSPVIASYLLGLNQAHNSLLRYIALTRSRLIDSFRRIPACISDRRDGSSLGSFYLKEPKPGQHGSIPWQDRRLSDDGKGGGRDPLYG